jgi:hypothetical protein
MKVEWSQCTAVCVICGERCTRNAGHDGLHMVVTAAGVGFHIGWPDAALTNISEDK